MQNKHSELIIIIIGVVLSLIVMCIGDNFWQQIYGEPFFSFLSKRLTPQISQIQEPQPTMNPWAGIVDIDTDGLEIISQYDLWFSSLAGNRWQVWHLDGTSSQLNRLRLDIEPQLQLLDEFVPAISPDKKNIAIAIGPCIDNGICNRDIYLANAEGKNVRRIAETCHDEFHPSWSPDAQYITYFSGGGGYDPECPYSSHGIWVVNLSNNQYFQLTDHEDYNPVWSPDGKYIAYNSCSPSQAIKVLDFSTCSGAINDCQTWITASPGGIVDSPGWVNNNTLVFSSNFQGNWDIYQVPFIPGQTLNPQRIVSSEWDDQYPAVSSDGRILVWQSFPYYKEGGDSGKATGKAAVLSIMDLNTGRAIELISGIGNSRDGFLIRK
jgi:Tol biopolymer transport system component